MSIETDSFEEYIDRLVSYAVSTGVATFAGIIFALPSVYPAEILASMRRLANCGRLPRDLLEKFKKDSMRSPVLSIMAQGQPELPVSHPLDFLWRKCLDVTKENDRIVLLGLPCMLLRHENVNVPRPVVLVDSDPVAVEMVADMMPSAETLCANLMVEHQHGVTGDVVVTDPPWYPEYVHVFLWSARRACKLGGRVLLCCPPDGTRPGVSREWGEMLDWAKLLGMVVEDVTPLALPYVSPLFERNALAAVDIRNYPVEWRRGNLVTFAIRDECMAERPCLPSQGITWQEEVVRGVRLRVRNNHGEGFASPVLGQLVEGDVLPSVSRRDERRTAADVWSCGNRVFSCTGRGVLLTIIGAMQRRVCYIDAVAIDVGRKLRPKEIAVVRSAAEQLDELVSIESDEIKVFHRG